jgi:FMN phosphatase YigB (HAD superfamily)
MPLSLEQYAKFLDGRADLLWPAAPEVSAPKAKPHLKKLPEIRVVTFSAYGTLVAIAGGELHFVHPDKFIMEAALEKTIQEFKMWQSMSRKPGKPSEYMGSMYMKMMEELRIARSLGADRYPELRSNELWELIVRRLMKNEYQFDAPFYGSVDELCEKISYFFHSSLQGTGPEAGALDALKSLREKGLTLGLIADGQCFTTVQLLRALGRQGKLARLADLFDTELVALSYEVIARKPSEQVYRALIAKLAPRDIAPNQVLHVGSNLPNDLVPARRLGFRTGLYAGDKSSVVATKEQLNEPTSRPDVLVTELQQIADMVG